MSNETPSGVEARLASVLELVKEQVRWEGAVGKMIEGGRRIESRYAEERERLRRNVRERAGRVRALVAEERERLALSVRRGQKAVQKKVAENVRFVDQLCFFLGVVNTWVTVALITLGSPLVVHWMLGWCAVMVALRVLNYSSLGWGYFVFDFCYASLLVLALFVYALPGHPRLFETVFLLSNGPVMLATLMWRNSLVFHSFDKMTSLLIHSAGPIATYHIRWVGGASYGVADADGPLCPSSARFQGDAALARELRRLGLRPDDAEAFCGMGAGEALLTSLAVYVIWNAFYLLKTQTAVLRVTSNVPVSRDESETTSFKYLANTSWAKFLSCVPRDHWEAFYVLYQLAYTLVTLLVALPMYRSQTYHTAAAAVVAACAVWFGATYYFEVFAKRAEGKYEKRRERAEELAAELLALSASPAASDLGSPRSGGSGEETGTGAGDKEKNS